MHIKVLYISYDGMTDPLGQSQVLPYIVGLSKIGFEFTLISFEKPDRYVLSKRTIQDVCDEHGIEWMPLKYTKFPPVLSTLWDLLKMRREINRLQKRQKRFNLIHCRSYLTSLLGLWAKRKWQTPMIFDMRGFWADERVDGGLWNLKHPLYDIIYRYFKKRELDFLKEANATITLTHAAQQELNNWDETGMFAPITVIPCCVDMNLFNPDKVEQQDVSELRNRLGISEMEKTLIYIGSVGTWYQLPEMLRFFKRLHLNDQTWRFLFVSQDEKEVFNAAALAEGVDAKLIKVVAAERKQMPKLASLADASIFFIKPSYSKIASSPTKQGELMAMGVPVFCNAGVGDTGYVVERFHSGTIVENYSDAGFDEAIKKFFLSDFDVQEIRKGAIAFFALEKGVQSYAQVYHRVIG